MFATIFAVVLNIFVVILVLGFLIFIHELGHYLAAKANDIQVDEFSIGMGPKLLGRRVGETEYTLRAFPIGGFVSILGEADSEDPKIKKLSLTSPRSYLNKKWWQKVIVLLAGVFMNFMSAVIIFYFLVANMDYQVPITDEVADSGLIFGEVGIEKVGDAIYELVVDEDLPAEAAGWPEKGVLTSIAGEDVSITRDIVKLASKYEGKEVDVEICTLDEEELSDNCDVYSTAISDAGQFGIMIGHNYYYYVEYSGVDKVLSGFAHSVNTVQLTFMGIGDVFRDAGETGDYTNAVNTFGGPVALYFIVDFVRDLGFAGVMSLVASLSLTLVIMNLLPIPVLDGGRVVLVFVREALGDYFSYEVENTIIGISYLFMMLLMLGIVVKDFFFINTFKELIESLR